MKPLGVALKKFGILDEWAIHLESKSKPQVMANYLIECLRWPENDRIRHATLVFLGYSRCREWKETWKYLKKYVSKEDWCLFETPHAGRFYRGFVKIVMDAIQSYWTQFLKKPVKTKRGKGS